MTKEPTEAQIKEACEVLDKSRYSVEVAIVSSLFAQRDAERAEHEAFREQVSDFAKRVKSVAIAHDVGGRLRETAETFIQPAPEPTPAEVLADAVSDVLGSCAALSDEQVAYHIRRILTMRGVELRFKDRSHEG